MPINFRRVRLSKSAIQFGRRIDPRTIGDFIVVLDDALSRGHDRLVLDFRKSERAYSSALLPMISLVEERRRLGTQFSLVLPTEQMLARLFVNANWAHLLDPAHPESPGAHPQHLPVRRYRTHPEQQEVVNAATDVVLKNMSLKRDAIAALDWTVNEITDNVLNHAQAPDGGLLQVNTFRENHRIALVVADGGRGIPAAMREAYPQLHDHDAITEATKAGVTSPRDAGQGNGLAGSLRIAKYAEGSFQIISGRASWSVYRDERTGKYRTLRGSAPATFKFPGTTVIVELSTTAEFDISEALALEGWGPLHDSLSFPDLVDLKYATSDDTLTIRVCDESAGVGTRHAGAELRRKCLNLLAADPSKRLVLDWSGLTFVSSSFADEAVGKLFVEMGFTAFASRVSHTGAEQLVASLLDRAVAQRVAQEAATQAAEQAESA